MHHPILSKFRFEPHTQAEGFRVNGLGVRERTTYYKQGAISVFQNRNSIVPMIEEEYIEWIDVLEAVDEARDEFVMVELGAGYGPWIVNAVAALRQVKDIPYRLAAVEADRTHFQFLRQHLADNHIDADRCRLIEAAVTAAGGFVYFKTDNQTTHYGQTVIQASHRLRARVRRLVMGESRHIIRIPSVTLAEVLAPYDRVDLIDCDIQGEEVNVFPPALPLLTEKVRRIHIGTHGAYVDQELRAAFSNAGWQNLHDYPHDSHAETPHGPIRFYDGVQTWLNPFCVR